MVAGFTALGEMAMALARVGAEPVMGPLLPRVADQIKEAISVKGRTRPNCPEALQVSNVWWRHKPGLGTTALRACLLHSHAACACNPLSYSIPRCDKAGLHVE